MKVINSMKLCLLAVVTIFLSCNQTDSSSPEHLNAVEWNETIEQIHQELLEKVEKFETENKSFSKAALNAPNPDPAVLRRIKKHETLIANYKGILQKQALLIEKNKAYLSKHESSALSAAEIQAQHEQIYKNLLIVQEDATQISETIDVVLTMYMALERTFIS